MSTREDIQQAGWSQTPHPSVWKRLVTRVRPKDATGLWIMVFLLPFLFLYGAFTLWPLIATFAYSLFDWGGIGPLLGKDFIALGNYSEMVHDPLFWSSFKNTLIFAFANTAIKLHPPLAVAQAPVSNRFLRPAHPAGLDRGSDLHLSAESCQWGTGQLPAPDPRDQGADRHSWTWG